MLKSNRLWALCKTVVNRVSPQTLILILLIAILTACTQTGNNSLKTPTLDLSQFAPEYNEAAFVTLPPPFTVDWHIWSDGVPTRPIKVPPRFINYPEPDFIKPTADLLTESGCGLRYPDGYLLDCQADSPLAQFGCLSMSKPDKILPGLEPDYPLVARCYYAPNRDDQDEVYLYRAGCISTQNVGYIFKIDGQYKLVNSIQAMQAQFAPIESSAEALSYALMSTGLSAIFAFENDDPQTLYYQDVIEGSHTTELADSYVVHLYHVETCGCLAYLTSQVDLMVGRDGTITWAAARPAYVTFHEGCVD